MKASDFDILIPQPVPEADVKPRWGVVTALSPLRVKLDGDEAQLPVTPASLVVGLTVGSRVWTILVGRQLVIVGVWGGLHADKVTKVALSSDFDVPNDVWTTIPWATEVFDDAGAWSSGDQTKIITPAGYSRVQVTLYTVWTASSAAVGRFTQIQKNGNTEVLSARRELFESGEQITTGWTPTTAGDQFTAMVNDHNSGANLLGTGGWGGPCWMEAVFRA